VVSGRARIVEETASLSARGVDVRGLVNQLEDQARQLRRLRGSIMALRMVSLREVLEPLGLIVRGLRNATGKSVRLEIDVGQAELDKSVAERIFPALVHLVRNAIDHGIEAPQVRSARGKPEQGLIVIESAARSSTHLEIVVRDDGAGVDAEHVGKRSGGELPASDQDLLEILTRPGFSTREQATSTSGRGLGMDIVRQSVEALGGGLGLQNSPGQGASFHLRVPLTVAMVDAFAFEARSQKFLVPVAMVDEICDISSEALVRPPGSHRPGAVELMQRRGEPIPIVSFGTLLGLGEAGRGDGAAVETRAIIVRRPGAVCAFSVGRVLGRHEVLIRPVVDPLVTAPGVSGSADLGDGRPTLVMDLLALSSVHASLRGAEASA
jgi:two-component system, chemotaxis family, sensor kinase CheA